MSVRIELEREDGLTVAQWEAFLCQARRAGADGGTAVAEVMCDPETVTIPTWLVHDLLSVAREVAQSDGDVRELESGARTALQNAYDHFLEPILGENPHSGDDPEPAATT